MVDHSEEVHDSPTGWVAAHIRAYVESDGEAGHTWRGVPTLLLTTRGRKTGLLRRSALIYGRDGDAFVLVASKGGAPGHPLWYLNLDADPEVRIQVGADHLAARARTAAGDERARLWDIMTEIWPDYETYRRRTGRQIPVVAVEPA
jgi:deazaflavin-dependent oxidoreductase (nitroreductase family)